MIACDTRLAPFDIAGVRGLTAYDELALDRMVNRKTANFFIISDTDVTYNFIIDLAFLQMFNLLCGCSFLLNSQLLIFACPSLSVEPFLIRERTN